MKRRLVALVACAIAVVASVGIPLALAGLAPLHELQQLPAESAVAIGAVVIVGWLAKAVKFRLLSGRLGQRAGFAACLAVSLGCDFGFAATPGGIGGYPATVFLLGRIGVAPACAAALMAADQTLDLAFFFATVPLAALWSLSRNMPHPDDALAAAVWLVVAVLTIGALVIGRLGRTPADTKRRCMRLRKSRFHRRAARLQGLWRETCTHLRALGAAPPAIVCAILAATSLQWIARLAVLGVALAWLGHAVPAAVVFLAQSVALHAGQWTGIPGGVGGTDLILARALAPWAPLATIAT
ncbi:MAG: lysylphosphatidylglycerol synthase domain-containing protein, partial [Rhodanobacteraceae bacterium]